MNAEVARCSAQKLKPILLDLQRWLPLELRELVYSYLAADHTPTVVPRTEPKTASSHVEPDFSSSRQDLNPFRPNFMFNTRVMGDDIAHETREYILRKTPVYFRGSQTTSELADFLEIQIQSRRYVRDVIRHLRVYLRCERFTECFTVHLDKPGDGMPPPWFKHEQTTLYQERRMYEAYCASLKGLQKLPYDKHPIKIEICILHELWETDDYTRYKTNFLEAIKPTYFHIKKAGADVTVRSEFLPEGQGEDVTWMLDLDAPAWEKVCRGRSPGCRDQKQLTVLI
jgi:hypothetical protein